MGDHASAAQGITVADPFAYLAAGTSAEVILYHLPDLTAKLIYACLAFLPLSVSAGFERFPQHDAAFDHNLSHRIVPALARWHSRSIQILDLAPSTRHPDRPCEAV
jgi:predicted anti-sigma-YlaC factor YlaD